MTLYTKLKNSLLRDSSRFAFEQASDPIARRRVTVRGASVDHGNPALDLSHGVAADLNH